MRREVRIGNRRPGSVEVLSGVAVGEYVIVEGTQKVRDGVPVRSTEMVVETLPPASGVPSHEANIAAPAGIRQ